MSNPNSTSFSEKTYQAFCSFRDLEASIEAFDDFIEYCPEDLEAYQLIKSLMCRLNLSYSALKCSLFDLCKDAPEEPISSSCGASTDIQLVNPNKTV